MLREAIQHPMDWCDNTMSMMREKQFEACEKRLSSHPKISLFADGATDADAQPLLDNSYDQDDLSALTTLSELRQRVMDGVSLEATALSQMETGLIERLLIEDGRLTLCEAEEIAAAESLVCRLWCGYEIEDGDVTLTLPEALMKPLADAMRSKACAEAREKLFRFDATVSGLLYIAGFLHSAQPVDCFLRDVLGQSDDMARRLAIRYLKSAYDYIVGADGELILLHPGLADPFRLVSTMIGGGVFTLELTQDMMMGGINGILPQEKPLNEKMIGALAGAVRPEWEPSEAAQDLRMLCKQGVSLETLQSVMESMLLMMPTEEMKSAVKQLYLFTPHWLGMDVNCKQ